MSARTPTSSDPKPLVQAACVCERVIVEPDNVPSLIRVVDTYFLSPIPPNLGVPAAVELTLFICLRSGDVRGEFEVAIRFVPPDNKTSIRRWAVDFGEGAENGVNLRIAFLLQEPKLELYWFDLLWGEEVLTRIPVRFKPRSEEPTLDVMRPNEMTNR